VGKIARVGYPLLHWGGGGGGGGGEGGGVDRVLALENFENLCLYMYH